MSGPVDPRWNPYKFYCQICKANISTYGKGAREILRHHSSEKQLRNDQRWRYEYLYKVDPVNKTKIHQVRGRDGRLLSPYQLELELPYFKDAPLVEIGQKLPFHDEFMAGRIICLLRLKIVLESNCPYWPSCFLPTVTLRF